MQCGSELQAEQKFCMKCGASVSQQAATPAQPQSQPEPVKPAPKRPVVRPDSHMGKAIAALIFFWPLGIPALVNATKVDNLWDRGATTEARAASDRADNYGGWGIALGIIIPIVYFVVYFIILAVCL